MALLYVLFGTVFTNFPIYVLVLSQNIFSLHEKLIFLKTELEKKKLYLPYNLKNLGCNSHLYDQYVLVQKSRVQMPIRERSNFFSHVFFSFIKYWILTHKILLFTFFYQSNINKNRYIALFFSFLCNLLIYKKK